jgi:hypothetical protein
MNSRDAKLVKNRALIKNTKTLAQEEDKKYLQTFLRSTQKEDSYQTTLYEKLKKDIKHFNDQKINDNLNWRRYNRETELGESYNFFPFTHGEQVEVIREQQKDQNRKELSERIKLAKKSAKVSRRENLSQSFYTPVSNNGGFEPDFDEFRRTGDLSVIGKGQITSSSGAGALTFTQPAKHYPYRRLNDTHVEKVMQAAIRRVEDNIKAKEDRAQKGTLSNS